MGWRGMQRRRCCTSGRRRIWNQSDHMPTPWRWNGWMFCNGTWLWKCRHAQDVMCSHSIRMLPMSGPAWDPPWPMSPRMAASSLADEPGNGCWPRPVGRGHFRQSISHVEVPTDCQVPTMCPLFRTRWVRVLVGRGQWVWQRACSAGFFFSRGSLKWGVSRRGWHLPIHHSGHRHPRYFPGWHCVQPICQFSGLSAGPGRRGDRSPGTARGREWSPISRVQAIGSARHSTGPDPVNTGAEAALPLPFRLRG